MKNILIALTLSVLSLSSVSSFAAAKGGQGSMASAEYLIGKNIVQYGATYDTNTVTTKESKSKYTGWKTTAVAATKIEPLKK